MHSVVKEECQRKAGLISTADGHATSAIGSISPVYNTQTPHRVPRSLTPFAYSLNLNRKDDPFIPLAEAHIVRDGLGLEAARTYFELPDHGHFQDATFPELLAAALDVTAAASTAAEQRSSLATQDTFDMLDMPGARDDVQTPLATDVQRDAEIYTAANDMASLELGARSVPHAKDAQLSQPQPLSPSVSSGDRRDSFGSETHSQSSFSTMLSSDFDKGLGGRTESTNRFTAGSLINCIGFVGCGTITAAMVRGLYGVAGGAGAPRHCILSPRNVVRSAELAAAFPDSVRERRRGVEGEKRERERGKNRLQEIGARHAAYWVREDGAAHAAHLSEECSTRRVESKSRAE